MTCYADDTLVLATGLDVEAALRGAETGTQAVIRRIEELGLRVCVDKTEAEAGSGAIHGERLEVIASGSVGAR